MKMTPLSFITLLLFYMNTHVANASCVPTVPDSVDLLVEDCYLSMQGYEVVKGRTLPHLKSDGIRTTTHSDWHTAPIERLTWRGGSNVRCKDMLLGSVLLAVKHHKCCDVVTHDILTGESSRPCDQDPFIISKPADK